jgi:eukaryotic-like serine/threonine-protein kinase
MSVADSLDAARAEREALLGQTIAGRYLLRKLIGHGGMGAVYEAEQLGIGKRVAVKFVDPEWAKDERIVTRFAREARAMSAIESAHIVSVLDAGSEHGRPYLVMELLRGEDLGARLRRERKLALPDAMHVAAQVLKGLARAHAAGIVHRDLKPDNVFLARSDTDPLFAKIVDFGVSKIERPRNRTSPLALTGRGTVLGTPFYMCPEQAQALPDIDGRADLYSVGAIVFECLSGRPPHTGETYEQVIISICMRDAPDIRAIDPSIPGDVAAFILRALARDRAQRPASAERMLAALHEVAPAEKERVPLDPPAPATLMSAGNDRPNMATRLGGSALPLDGGGPVPPSTRGAVTMAAVPRAKAASDPAATIRDSPAARAPSASDGSISERGPSSARDAALAADDSVPSTLGAGLPPKRKVPTLVVTGVTATLAGVVLMLLVVALLEKRSAPSAIPTITTASPATAAAPSVVPSPIGVVPSPVAVVPSSSVSSPAVSAPASRGPSTGKSAAPRAVKPKGSALDIARDLP